jgi:hypothetical protein
MVIVVVLPFTQLVVEQVNVVADAFLVEELIELLYQFTAIDDCTRIRVLKIYDACNQRTAIQFMDEVVRRLPFRVQVVQTDNGAEFQSAFHWHLERLDIRHVYIRPQAPPRATKPRPSRFLWIQRVREEIVIGGGQLQPEAKERKRKTGAKEQQLLAEAEYKPDEIWTRPSRVQAQLKIERWYYGFMLCALLTVVIAAFATQTLLSGESPLATAQRAWNQNSNQQR